MSPAFRTPFRKSGLRQLQRYPHKRQSTLQSPPTGFEFNPHCPALGFSPSSWGRLLLAACGCGCWAGSPTSATASRHATPRNAQPYLPTGCGSCPSCRPSTPPRSHGEPSKPRSSLSAMAPSLAQAPPTCPDKLSSPPRPLHPTPLPSSLPNSSDLANWLASCLIIRHFWRLGVRHLRQPLGLVWGHVARALRWLPSLRVIPSQRPCHRVQG